MDKTEHDAIRATFEAEPWIVPDYRKYIIDLLDALDESEKECADAKADRDRWKARFEVLKTILKNRNPADLCRLCVNLKTFDDSCSDCMCISGLLDKFELDDAFLKKGDGQS